MGLILLGSRGAGVADALSDYDFAWVLSDVAYQVASEQGGPRSTVRRVNERKVEVCYVCPATLQNLADSPSWRNLDFATAVVLFDRTGGLIGLIDAVVTMPPERAAREAAAWYDAYLNGYYRSVKAHHRANEFGARLQAVESVVYLVKTLFALVRRVAPHHDRLLHQIGTIEYLAWERGSLLSRLLGIVRTADPASQHRLEREVAGLMRARLRQRPGRLGRRDRPRQATG